MGSVWAFFAGTCASPGYVAALVAVPRAVLWSCQTGRSRCPLSGGAPDHVADAQLLRHLRLLFEGRLCVCVLQTKNFDILFHVTYCKKEKSRLCLQLYTLPLEYVSDR